MYSIYNFMYNMASLEGHYVCLGCAIAWLSDDAQVSYLHRIKLSEGVVNLKEKVHLQGV